MILKGKTVLVTGGSKGIGRCTVEAMAALGANVIINYSKDKKAAEEVASEVKKHSVQVMTIQADIADKEQVDLMFKAIEDKFNTLDVLVNNAGFFSEPNTPDNLEAFENDLKTNLFAQVYVTNKARKLMTKGKIIFISTIHAKLGHGRPDAIAYSASKAALNSYLKNLAKYLAPDILVNGIEPGRTLTPLWGEMDENYKKEQAAGQLIGRWIEPSEIADGVVFLAKNDAMCGEILVIDGGMSLKVFG